MVYVPQRDAGILTRDRFERRQIAVADAVDIRGSNCVGSRQLDADARFANESTLTRCLDMNAIPNTRFENRTPSVSWEPVPLDPSGQLVAWVWYRPATLPTGFSLLIPANLYADPQILPRLTLRQLVMAAGVDPSQIYCWSVGGTSFDAAGGTSPLLDQVIPYPQPAANQEISVWMAVAAPAAWPQAPMYPAEYAQQGLPQQGFPQQGLPQHGFPQQGFGQPFAATGGITQLDAQLLEAMELAWKDVLQLEARVSSLRKDLGSMMTRVSSVNRELSAHERLSCTSKDLAEWSEIRRFLRDATSVIGRSVKEIDLGTTSGAGRRHRFNEMYLNYVVPRISFPELGQAVNELDTYRKILQSVLASAQAAVARGSRDAENRASSFLQRVHAKMMSRRK